MQQKCTHGLGRQQAIISALKLAGICYLLGLSFVSPKILAAEPENLPPAGSQLAFIRDDQIYLVNADGTGLVQLTDAEPGIANSDPAWSRDGKRLAFARGMLVPGLQEVRDLYIMDADGSNVVQLTSGGYNVDPAWGPDDTIAFTSFCAGGTCLKLIDANGSVGTTVLHDYPGYDAQSAWSPDGQTITFTTDWRAYDFVYDLYAMNADGSEVRSLLEGPFFASDGPIEYYQSAWSPDGKSLAVVSCPYAFDSCHTILSTIAILNSDGSGLREIALAGGYASPTWSPDGRWIAFGSSSCRSCGSSIRFVRVDGGVEGLLAADGHSPAWRPDPDIQDTRENPEGPIKEPDEPKDPEDPKKPPLIKLPECGSKCEKKDKLTRANFPDE